MANQRSLEHETDDSAELVIHSPRLRAQSRVRQRAQVTEWQVAPAVEHVAEK